jgi:hypothetical protein
LEGGKECGRGGPLETNQGQLGKMRTKEEKQMEEMKKQQGEQQNQLGRIGIPIKTKKFEEL